MLEVEYMRTNALRAYAGNAKEHPQEQVEQIAQSIEQFGFVDPVAVWGPENMIVEGHGRVQAARLLGMEEVPVIRLDELSDEQRRAYTLVHNQLTLNSGFDAAALQAELEAIDSIDMEAFDFGLAEAEAEGRFSVDDIEQYRSYEAENDNREWFTTNFTFPAKKKAQVTAYLQKHKAEITEQILKASTAGEETEG